MKNIISFAALSGFLLLSACQTSGTNWMESTASVFNNPLFQSSAATALSSTEIGAGLREALRVGTDTVVAQLGKSGGFNLDPKIQIPLPSQLQKVDNVLSSIGLGGMTTDLKSRMNTAAEIATPRAKDYFLTAISSMTINDAKTILNGPENAATSYLRKTMGSKLAGDISPVIQNALNQAGAIQAYDNVMGQYSKMPFMPDVKANLNSYVVEKTLDGIFYYVAQEEAAIRANPAKRTTEILQKVFGTKSE